MHSVLLAVHILICALVVLVVLIQSGRGAGFSLFGGGGDALFSAPSGSSFIRKFTAGLATVYFITSLLLTFWSSHMSPRSLMPSVIMPPTAAESPVLPAGTQPPKTESDSTPKAAPAADAEK